MNVKVENLKVPAAGPGQAGPDRAGPGQTHRQPEAGHLHRLLIPVSLFSIIDQLRTPSQKTHSISSGGTKTPFIP